MDNITDKNISTIEGGDVVAFSFMKEKIENCGEDSNPILIVNGDCYALGVFDGMGGAGSTKCESTYGIGHTQAYVASRITKEVVEEELNAKLNNNEIILECNTLRDKILTALQKEKEKDTTPPSKLRSQVIRSYPTTLAVITASRNDGNADINSYWAGDSRNYLLTPSGLYQLSQDDLVGETDPYENLRNDSPVSNCICIDREFSIRHLSMRIECPCILISTTDGCFGYFHTPMHFEWLLRSTLGRSSNMEEWKQNILSEIIQVAGDDISLSLIAIGYQDWADLKDKNLKAVSCVDEILANEQELLNLSSQLKQKQEDLERLKFLLWENYKKEYLSLLANVNVINTTTHQEQDISPKNIPAVKEDIATDESEYKSEIALPKEEEIKKD